MCRAREWFFDRWTHPHASALDPRGMWIPSPISAHPNSICLCGWTWWCFHPVPSSTNASFALHDGMRSTRFLVRAMACFHAIERTRTCRQKGATCAHLPPCHLWRTCHTFGSTFDRVQFGVFSISLAKISMNTPHRLDVHGVEPVVRVRPTVRIQTGAPGRPRRSTFLPAHTAVQSPPTPFPNPYTAEAPPLPRCFVFVRGLTPPSAPPPRSCLRRVNLPSFGGQGRGAKPIETE